MMPTSIQALVWAILGVSIAINAWFLQRAAKALDSALDRIGTLELWRAREESRRRTLEHAQYPAPVVAPNTRRG